MALAPEDAFFARHQKPSVGSLLQVGDLLPQFMYNAYGASLDWIARDRPLLRDAVAGMIEANRAMFTDRARFCRSSSRPRRSRRTPSSTRSIS